MTALPRAGVPARAEDTKLTPPPVLVRRLPGGEGLPAIEAEMLAAAAGFRVAGHVVALLRMFNHLPTSWAVIQSTMIHHHVLWMLLIACAPFLMVWNLFIALTAEAVAACGAFHILDDFIDLMLILKPREGALRAFLKPR